MSFQTEKPLTVFAPAKINLYLHVTGRRPDGYHELDSLVNFADIGDQVEITSSSTLAFDIIGPFAGAFRQKERSADADSTNLVIKAARGLSRIAQKTPSLKITLTKNIPLGAGLGGGSADAAATLWGLLEYWNLPRDLDGLDELMLSLGADVPVCFASEARLMRGIGDMLAPAPSLPEQPLVLVHPGKPCNTARVFSEFSASLKDDVLWGNDVELTELMTRTENMLTPAAVAHVPEIQNILQNLTAQNGCTNARMSGSGSACFGIFDSEAAAETAAHDISSSNPDWWVQSGWLGRVSRY